MSPLSLREREVAESFIAKLVQQDYFGELYSYIRALKGNVCYKVSKSLKRVFQPLKNLSVFCDDNGFLRSHSRIANANLPFSARFPIILPQRHNFVELLVHKVHFEFGHFGWSYVLAKIQNRFWDSARSISSTWLP